MKKKKLEVDGKKILFVCYGNTCRSPMAEGLAKKSLGERACVESAGLAPVFDSAADEAVTTVRILCGVDISHHVPRSVTETPLRSFDWIIILDGYVFKTMKKLASDLEGKLVFWDIPDPFGKDMGFYKSTADKIWNCIRDFLL